MDLVARVLVEPLAGLGGKEKILAMPRHPGSNTQFGVAIAGSGINMIDAVCEQDVQHAIRFCLRGSTERRSAKECHCTHMACTAKGAFFNHKVLLRGKCALQDNNTAAGWRL